jgi:hypothetical protein
MAYPSNSSVNFRVHSRSRIDLDQMFSDLPGLF